MAFKADIPHIICIFGMLFAAWRPTIADTVNVQSLTDGMQSFGAHLLSELAQRYPHKNIVISPFSIQTCLTMARMGAEGQTAAEIDQAFGLNFSNTEDLAQTYHTLLQEYENSSVVKMANKIYTITGYTVQDTFNRLLTEEFYSKVDSIDFADSARAANTINTWVEKKTNDLIKDLVKPDLLDATTLMVLVNAIHFKGNWAHKFHKAGTSDFFLDATKTIPVPMMFLETDFRYADLYDLDAQALEIPYADSDLSMLVILPNKLTGLVQLVNKLKDTPLNEIVQNMTTTLVYVKLPKFKVEFDDELSKTLSKLGLKRMFSDNAQFGKILESAEGIKVSAVMHKALIEVNEVGTEAAAASAVGGVALSASLAEEFIVDHGFFYAIRSGNGAVLFEGVQTFNS